MPPPGVPPTGSFPPGGPGTMPGAPPGSPPRGP
jgi:hypothetical protein